MTHTKKHYRVKNFKTPRPLLTIPVCNICNTPLPPSTEHHTTHCEHCTTRLQTLKNKLKTIQNNENNS